MAKTAITANIHHALDIHLDFTTQIAFDHEVLCDVIPNRGHLRLGQVTDLGAGIYIACDQCLSCKRPTDPMNIGQSNFDPFVAW